MTTKHTDEMREAFESKFAQDERYAWNMDRDHTDDTYNDECIDWAWYGYQVATASAEGKYLPVIEKASALAEMITRPYSGDPEDPSWTDIQDLAVNLRAEAAPLLKKETV